MYRNLLASGGDLSTCQQTGSSTCSQQYEVDYTYLFDNPSKSRVMATLVNPLSKKVLSYTENRDGVPQPRTEETDYTIQVPTSYNAYAPPSIGGTTTIKGPDGSTSTIVSGPGATCTNTKSGLCSALISSINNPDGTVTQLGWTSSTFSQTAALSNAWANPYPQYVVTTVGPVAKGISMVKDQNGNTTSASEYNWFDASKLSSGIAGALPGATRTTTSAFYPTGSSPNYWDHGAPLYLRGVYTSTVNAGTTAYATTVYSYDSATTTANLTSKSIEPSGGSPILTQSWTYSSNGSVLTATDPNGAVTNIVYDPSNSLYPKEVDWAYGLPEQRTYNTFSYDTATGLLLGWKDSDNSFSTTYTYDDLGRQTKISESGQLSGVPSLSRSTTISYDDTGQSVTTTQDQTSLSSTTYYDPLGRVRLTQDAAGNKVQRAYQPGSSGASYVLESKPYASGSQPNAWTLTKSQAGPLSSTGTTVETFNDSNPPAPWGSATSGSATSTGKVTTTAYDTALAGCSGSPPSCVGPSADGTDQASNVTKYYSDGLGRLTSVLDAAGTTTTNAYDILDNLISVTQYGQTRSFLYDVAGRLITACNPESSSADCTKPLSTTTQHVTQYSYDSKGNLSTKTDAAGNVITYSGYDGFGRPGTVSYTPTTTASVSYGYDGTWKGALSSTSRTVGDVIFGTSYTYDALGRVASSKQSVGANTSYAFSYNYSLADELTSIGYPSGRVVNYTNVSGQVTAVKSGAGTKYATGISYGRRVICPASVSEPPY